jgi:hypothetical protein
MKTARLIIAIDFGTYASGFAFVSPDDRGRPAKDQPITIYRDWPGSQEFKYFKTRTALLRSASGDILSWGNKACIDYEVQQRRGKAYGLCLKENFKLDLTSPYSAKQSAAVTDTVDFLSRLREKALKVIGVERGIVVPADQIRWCITMPVIAAAGAATYEAILRNKIAGPAGFPVRDRDNLIFLAEPEAAALSSRLAGWIPSERFTVIDAGGGTVDITTLQVNDNSSLSQIGFHAGGKLGSRILDINFRSLLLQQLQNEHGWQQNASPNPEDWATIISNWEQDKRSWDFDVHETYHVRIPRRKDEQPQQVAEAYRQRNISGDIALSSGRVMGEVFEPLVSKILSELNKAEANLPEGPPVKNVLLVGGFGGSPYLQRRLREHIADRAQLVTFPDPKSAEAVLRGAMQYALDLKSIQARRMQYTYGCDTWGECKRPGEKHATPHHMLRYERWSSKENECCLQLLIFARRGEVIEASTERAVAQLFPADSKQRSVTFNLYATTAPDPYFPEDCKKIGSVELPTRIPWWRSILWRPIDVKVTLGESGIIFYASDRKHPNIYREISLNYLEGGEP